jgi:hypothetical protein
VHRKKEGEAALIIVKTIPRIAVLPSRGQCLNTVTSGTQVTQRFCRLQLWNRPLSNDSHLQVWCIIPTVACSTLPEIT